MKLFSEFSDVRIINESLTHTLLKAIDTLSGEPVLITAINLFTADPEDIERFRHEQQDMAHLDLDGVVTPILFAESETYVYAAIPDQGEVLLNHYLRRQGALGLEESLSIAMSLVGVLGELHSARKLVGHLCPSMILYSPSQLSVRLLSMGLGDASARSGLQLDRGIYAEFALSYCAPEVIDGSLGLDHRADFFSLGVLCYQLLTGRLPFEGATAAELMVQIARGEAEPIAKILPDIPAPVADIVKRLMSHNPTDRYQSVWGINADLERCLDQFHSTGQVLPFKLGENDVNSAFRIPTSLFGRDTEVNQLTGLFHRVEKGGHEVCFVRGFSGIGKTELVMRQFANRPGVTFCASRFDILQKDRSYATVLNAFRGRIRQMLSDPVEASLLRERLRDVVEGNGQLLIDLLPELEGVIGLQLSCPASPHSAENQHRLNRLFARFVTVFALPDQPLVLFLDDLQWADGGTLSLIESLITDKKLSYFMFVGAYRDNEISQTHPVNEMIGRLVAQNISFNDFPLMPLTPEEIIAYLRDTFAARDCDLIPFARLVEEKTAGNPFFIAEFLKVLHQESLVFFDPEQARWCWELTEIQSKDIPLTLVDFLTDKIERLNTEVQQSLMLASCLGNDFDLFTLAMVSGNTLAKTSELLKEAVNEGVLVESDRLYEQAEMDVAADSERAHVAYQFRHHRIRQAVSSLIFKDSRPAIHLKVGRLLLDGCDDEALLDERIFEIADHFGLASSLIVDPQERNKLSELNHRAGLKAKTILDYQAAFRYQVKAMEFLPKNGWETHYEKMSAVYTDLIDAAFLVNEHDKMAEWVKTVEKHVHTPLELLPVYETMIHSFNVRMKPLESLDLIFYCAELLGFELPRVSRMLKRKLTVFHYRRAIVGKTAESIVQLPPMKDRHRAALIRIVVRYGSALYVTNPELFALLSYRLVTWQLREGLTPESALSFASLGVYFSGSLKDFDQASFMGDVALHLLERPTSRELEARVLMLVSAYILPWVRPVQDVLKPLARAGQIALEIGDHRMAMFALAEQVYMQYTIGRPLLELEDNIALHRAEIMRIEKQVQLHYFCQMEQFLHNMIHVVDKPCRLVGEYYDEDKEMAFHLADNYKNALFSLNHFKLVLNFSFGNYEEALYCAQKNRELMHRVTGWFGVVGFYFYESLSCFAVIDDTPHARRRSELLLRVNENIEQIKRWSTHAPSNHDNKRLLLQAELARVEGDEGMAAQCYGQSISLARGRGVINEQAIATERAACFYHRFGKHQMAQDYMEDAIDLTELWGAKPIADVLRQRYSSWLS